MEAKDLSEGAELHGTYRLSRLLGQGGMGAVFEATHMRLPRRVAIKFLLGEGASDPSLSARFRREAEIASRLVHPNIVDVHDYNTLEDGTPYLVMDLLEGEDLRARLSRGRLSYEEARELVLQVVSALDLAHAEGIVHRDLKPENIFLCRQADGTTVVKVLDFGISKLQDSGTRMTREDVVMGTPGYMAPEQAMGKNSTVDRRTDLFSLATIFYEMVTGENVFLGQTLAEIVYKVTQFVPEPLGRRAPSVPSSVSNAVAIALSKDQGERQPSVSAFAAAFYEERSHYETALLSDPDPSTSATVQAPSSSAPLVSAPTTAASVYRPAPTLPPIPEASAERESVVEASQRPTTSNRTLIGVLTGVAVGASAVALTLGMNAQSPPSTQPVREEPTTVPPSPISPPTANAEAAPDTPPNRRPSPEAAPTAPTPRARPIPAPKDDTTSHRAEPSSPGAAPPSPPSPSPSPPHVTSRSLQEASTALEQGNYAEAVRLARRSLQETKSSTAYLIMAKAYCGRRDIGMARAMQRNLGPSSRRQVASFCLTHGIELDP